jgi:hypothetical protein
MKRLIKYLIKSLILNVPDKFEKIDVATKASAALLNNMDNLISEFEYQKGPDLAWYELNNRFITELSEPRAIDNFLRTPTILATMNEVFLPKLIVEYFYVTKYLSKSGYDVAKILEENNVGNQIPFILNRKTSGNLVHHLFHCTEFLKFSGIKINRFRNIYEIGAGYGSMYRVVRKFEFSGKYCIYDLPLFAELQKFYLGAISLLEEGKLTWNESTKNQKIKPGSLLIATWSLSEINIDKREKYQTLLNECDYFLIGFRDTFEGVNNLTYFEDIMKKRPDLQFDIRKIKGIENSYYLFAKPLSKRA